MKKSAKIIAAIAATAIAGSAAIGGTLAWLTSNAEVTNTFTMGNVRIELTEQDIDGDGRTSSDQEYKLTPGTTTTKDPTITVKANSEDCYVFAAVKDTLTSSEGFSLNNSVLGTTWKKIDSVTLEDGYVLYMYNTTVATSTSDQNFKLFDGIVVGETVTELPTDATIDIKAFAVQEESLDEADAIDEAEDAFNEMID